MTDNIKGGATIVVDDAHMVANYQFEDIMTDEQDQITDGSKNIPHNMDSIVTTSTLREKLKCPKCGKSTLHAEFPDQYEAWTKCSSCNFFMGMGKDDWHRIVNSHNINEKIKKMAFKKECLP